MRSAQVSRVRGSLSIHLRLLLIRQVFHLCPAKDRVELSSAAVPRPPVRRQSRLRVRTMPRARRITETFSHLLTAYRSAVESTRSAWVHGSRKCRTTKTRLHAG